MGLRVAKGRGVHHSYRPRTAAAWADDHTSPLAVLIDDSSAIVEHTYYFCLAVVEIGKMEGGPTVRVASIHDCPTLEESFGHLHVVCVHFRRPGRAPTPHGCSEPFLHIRHLPVSKRRAFEMGEVTHLARQHQRRTPMQSKIFKSVLGVPSSDSILCSWPGPVARSKGVRSCRSRDSDRLHGGWYDCRHDLDGCHRLQLPSTFRWQFLPWPPIIDSYIQ